MVTPLATGKVILFFNVTLKRQTEIWHSMVVYVSDRVFVLDMYKP